ncbi:unnamed protein product [Arabidopsis halleri]
MILITSPMVTYLRPRLLNSQTKSPQICRPSIAAAIHGRQQWIVSNYEHETVPSYALLAGNRRPRRLMLKMILYGESFDIFYGVVKLCIYYGSFFSLTLIEECAEGEECAAVLRAMLNVKSAEEKVEKGQSGRMSVVECLGKLSSSSSSSSSSLPAFVIEMDGSYIVDFKSIISVPRYHEMKAAVKRTYGEEFSQMFNYLLEKEDCLFETSEIVGAVGIEEEAALRGLFDMRKGGYMRMEKLLVRGVDMPILQWKIDTNFVIRTMLNIWYDASKLILLKKGHEIPPHIFPTEYELDDAIMIFHDY